MGQLICAKCRKLKDSSEFYLGRHEKPLDKCKPCHNIESKINYCRARILYYQDRISQLLEKGYYVKRPRYPTRVKEKRSLKAKFAKGGDSVGEKAAEKGQQEQTPGSDVLRNDSGSLQR